MVVLGAGPNEASPPNGATCAQPADAVTRRARSTIAGMRGIRLASTGLRLSAPRSYPLARARSSIRSSGGVSSFAASRQTASTRTRTAPALAPARRLPAPTVMRCSGPAVAGELAARRGNTILLRRATRGTGWRLPRSKPELCCELALIRTRGVAHPVRGHGGRTVLA